MKASVHKFGGTSLADGARIRAAARLLPTGGPAVVVVSALAGVTDTLSRLATEDVSHPDLRSGLARVRAHHESELRAVAHGETRVAASLALEAALERVDPERDSSTPEWRDRVLALGEDLSALVFAAALETVRPAVVVDPRGVVHTDDRFGRARPDADGTRARVRESLVPHLEAGKAVVVGGFVGSTGDGRTTTLGRGGSDLSAVVIGAALGSEVTLWTDVEGLLSGDPTCVEAPRIIREIGFEEAVELASFGAHVVHPGAAKYAVARDVPLTVRSTFDLTNPGTRILARRRASHTAAVAHKTGVVMIEVRSHPTSLEYGFLADVFEVLGRHRVPVDLVATSHSSTAFTIDETEEIEEVAEELERHGTVRVLRGLATLTVVGGGVLSRPGAEARIFDVIGQDSVYLVSQASEVSMSLVVNAERAPDLTRRLHDALVGPRTRAAEGTA